MVGWTEQPGEASRRMRKVQANRRSRERLRGLSSNAGRLHSWLVVDEDKQLAEQVAKRAVDAAVRQ